MRNVLIRSILLLSIAALAGCGEHAAQTAPANPVSEAAPTPPATTEASPSHTSSDSPSSSSSDASSKSAPAQPNEAKPANAADQAAVQNNLNRLFLERPAPEEFAGSAVSPGGEKLLNAKAEHFAQFTRPLLQRLYSATEDVERQRLTRSGVPSNLRPVIIEATMNSDGQLTELVLQQLSGSGAVDQAMIEACKEGLWMRYPPPEARTADGNYRMRIEATIKNYMRPTSFDDWTLKTHLGLALE